MRTGGEDARPEPARPTTPRLDERKMAAARFWGAMRFPYLASALFATSIVSVPRLGTIAVDEAWRLYVDPELVRRWSPGEIGSVLVHHVGHLLRDHAGRARALGVDRESESRWVLAADAEINDDLMQSGDGDMPFPLDPVLPSDLGFEPGKFAEEYFRLLPEWECRPCQCGSGAHGRACPWEAADQSPGGIASVTAHLLRCQVASEIRERCGKEPGTVPIGWRRWADALLRPRVDWRKVLAAEIRKGIASVAGAVDYSYKRPSRRASIAGPVVLPALRKPLPNLAVVIDTSGSMSEHLLGEVLAEVEGLLNSVGLGRDRLHVVVCDAAVHKVQRVTSARQVELFGGGGTNMGEGIEAALKLRPRPDVVVVLTDGYTPWPQSAPGGARVVVAIVGDGSWPVPEWARAVRIESVG